MSLEARKLEFIQEFLKLENEDIVRGLEHYLRQRKAALIESSFEPMTMEQYNAEIDQELDDSENYR